MQNVYMKCLNIRWRLTVHTNAVDCSGDFLSDVLFLTLFDPTFQAEQHNCILLVFSCFGISFQLREVLFLCRIRYLLQARQAKP